MLGGMPERPDFPAVEVRNERRISELEREHPSLKGKRKIVSSDAHRLWEILDPGWRIELPCAAEADAQTVRHALIDYLNGTPDGGRA
jgi:hypothetical protein